jgi:ferrous iron transport protein A
VLPLSVADTGVELIVRKIGGSPEIKKHLEDLGFTVGGSVSVVSKLGENVIVRVKESRIAINDEMARRIMV